MKKILCLVLTLLFAAISLIGCGSGSGNNSGNANSGNTNSGNGGSTETTVNLHPDKDVKATLRVAVTNYNAEKKIVSEIGQLLTKQYPNVTIKLEEFSTKISDQYASWYRNKNVPDILINNSFDMFTLSDKGILADLDPYLRAEAADPESTFDINDYYESYMEMGQENFDGRQLMIPRSSDRVVCHYNAAIFKAAGVDMSLVKNGWTWDDFMKVCATLRAYYDANNMKNYTLIDTYFTWEAVYNPIFESYGVQYFDEKGNVTLDSANTENALKFMRSIIDNRYASKPSVEQAGMEGNKGCMLFHSQAASLMATKLAAYYPDAEKVSDYYNVVTMPVIPGHEKIGCGAAGYSVYEGSENKDLAWQFLKILLSKEGQNIMADCGSNYVPVRKDMADYTNPENHWGKGYEDLNLSAYTYNCGADEDPDWNCYTTFITQQKPKQATNISNAITGLISNYCNGEEYTKAINACTSAIKRYILM